MWSNVNLDERELYIKNTRITAKSEIFQESTKTLSSYRTLPIEQEMYDYLTELKQKQEDDKKFYGNAYCDSGFVCCYDNGEPLKVSYISHAFSDLLKRIICPIFVSMTSGIAQRQHYCDPELILRSYRKF